MGRELLVQEMQLSLDVAEEGRAGATSLVEMFLEMFSRIPKALQILWVLASRHSGLLDLQGGRGENCSELPLL